MAAIDRVADVTLSAVLDPVLQDGANVPVVADLDTLAACSDGVILAVPNAIRGAAAEEVSVAILRFASGALGTVNLSDVSLGPWSWELTAGENPAYPATDQSSYVIGGCEGSLALPNLTPWRQSNGPDWWAPMTNTAVPSGSADPLEAQIVHFAAVIGATAKPLVSGADGLRAVRVIEAIKAAALNGSAVSIAP